MRAEGGRHDGGVQWVHALDQFFDRGLYFVIIGPNAGRGEYCEAASSSQE